MAASAYTLSRLRLQQPQCQGRKLTVAHGEALKVAEPRCWLRQPKLRTLRLLRRSRFRWPAAQRPASAPPSPPGADAEAMDRQNIQLRRPPSSQRGAVAKHRAPFYPIIKGTGMPRKMA
mmetsp:Transcript_64087/g.139411  ORF Transcript_64087/g.139411 Transcript_64087/m.139411 type:complete len:119 (+) Transcript_64087:1359-1715(+)